MTANATLREVVADRIRIIGLVGDEGSWRPLRRLDQRVVAFTVCRFARREVEGDRSPSGITETMNFTGEPAPRAAKSSLMNPPFPPAAETWARTGPLSAIVSARAMATLSHTPQALLRRKRR